MARARRRAGLTYAPDKYAKSSRRLVQDASLVLPACKQIGSNDVAICQIARAKRTTRSDALVMRTRVYVCCTCVLRM